MLYQIWQKDHNGQRVLWGYLNNLTDTIGIVQMMVDGMKDGWQPGFEIIVGEEHIEMTAFCAEHQISKKDF